MVEYRSLRPGEESKLVSAIMAVPFFAQDPAIVACDYLNKHVFGETTYDPTLTKVAVEGDKIVSQVVVQPRVMNSVQGPLLVGGVALVGTVPGHERKGHSTTLLNMATEDLTKRGYDASMLFTKNPFFYKQEGWTPLKREFVLVPANTKVKSEGLLTGKHSFAIDRKEDFLPDLGARLAPIYDQFTSGKPLFVKRSQDYWKNRLSNNFMYPAQEGSFCWFDEAEGAHGVKGYAFFEVKKNANAIIIKEAAWENPAEIGNILIRAALEAEYNGVDNVGMFGLHLAPHLKRRKGARIISSRDGVFIEEDILFKPLKKGIKVEEPVLFWPTDHF